MNYICFLTLCAVTAGGVKIIVGPGFSLNGAKFAGNSSLEAQGSPGAHICQSGNKYYLEHAHKCNQRPPLPAVKPTSEYAESEDVIVKSNTHDMWCPGKITSISDGKALVRFWCTVAMDKGGEPKVLQYDKDIDLSSWTMEKVKIPRNMESLGCNLIPRNPDVNGMRLGFRTLPGASDGQVHWSERLQFQDRRAQDCQDGSTVATFYMPDYCSRAIVSELATVYRSKWRTPKQNHTKSYTGECSESSDSDIFSTSGKLERDFIEDYKALTCQTRYQECKCPEGEDCSFSKVHVECCKKAEKIFLTRYHSLLEEIDNEYGKIFDGKPSMALQ
mmetsp:Transcript_146861/g.258838  ORF Transcript_146861/g.258838 Transcript_146861/m.258838 type:complete len:331 (-) Transcript_146861:67-1059(-)